MFKHILLKYNYICVGRILVNYFTDRLLLSIFIEKIYLFIPIIAIQVQYPFSSRFSVNLFKCLTFKSFCTYILLYCQV